MTEDVQGAAKRSRTRAAIAKKREAAGPAASAQDTPVTVPEVNERAAGALEELVSLLQRHWSAYNQDGKLGMKVASYRKAAAQLRRHGTPVDELGRQGKLQSIPGVGAAIAKKLEEFLDRGSFKLLDELRALDAREVPPEQES